MVSLRERLEGAPLVVRARVKGVVERWPDPCATATQEFALLEMDVVTVLRGDAPKRLLVRISGALHGKEVRWSAPIDPDQELVMILAIDEPGDPPRYGLQYGSAFRLVDDRLEVPDDLLLDEYPAEEPGRLSLETLARLLSDLESHAARRRAEFEEVEGRGWQERPYPEVEEVGDPRDEQRRDAAGPRDGRPGTAFRLEREPD